MKTRQIGSTSDTVSALGLGCMGMSEFYGPTDEARSLQVLRLACDLGITLFDTADIYGVDGHNERLLGRALKGVRRQVRIATKFGFVKTDDRLQKNAVSGRPDYVRSACEQSLARLGTDFIDLYYMHRLDPAVPIEDTVGAMADLVRSGKVRALGLCEVSAATLRRAMAVHPISVVQSEFSLWSRDVQANGVLDTCESLGVSLVPFSPLGRGFLTGRVNDATVYEASDLRSTMPRFQPGNLRENVKLLDRLKRFAAERGATCGQLALAWLLAQSDRVVPIPGMDREEHLRENVGALDLALTPADLALLDDMFPVGAAKGDRYSPVGMQMVHM
jgi:aryl-alcohol dehydrogenase-like predicted oxidoreductase